MWKVCCRSRREAGRLASALPPEAAVHRGDTLDERYLSTEARLLRLLFNVQVEEKHRLRTVDELAVEGEKRARMKAKAEARLALQRAREGGVTGG